MEAAPGLHPAKTSSLGTTCRFPPPWTAEDIGAAFNARSALQLGGGVAKLSALNPNHPW